MARSSVAAFNINLNKSSYFAGEAISGSVSLRTTAPIKCRSIQFEIKAKGYCGFYAGHGDKREFRTHEVKYWKEERTLWGPYYRTDDLDNAGSNAVWGSPFAPNGGVLMIPVEDRLKPLILRVMDEDWGKRDDLLGEVMIYPESLVAEAAAGEVTMPLKFKGQHLQSTVTLTASWCDGGGKLRLEVLRALGLRQADWFSKNDVYVQVYYPPYGTKVDPTFNLPEPNREAELPAGEYTFELEEFNLPDDLPASFEGSNCYVRFYAQANIDIKWRLDPFTRCCFTVMPRLPTALALLSSPCKTEPMEKMKHPSCYCPPFCCPQLACGELECIDQGMVMHESSLSRGAGAPGEQLFLSATAANKTEGPVYLVVLIESSCVKWAEGRTQRDWEELTAFRQEIGPGATLELNNAPVSVPYLPPSYHGGLLINEAWQKKVESYGGSYPSLYWKGLRTDPVVWWYQVKVGIDIPDCRFDLIKKFPFTVTSVPAAVVSVPAVVVAPAPQGMEGYDNNAPPTYLPVKVAESVPVAAVTGETEKATWVVHGEIVEVIDSRDERSNACAPLTYQPHYFIPSTAVTVVQNPNGWSDDIKAA